MASSSVTRLVEALVQCQLLEPALVKELVVSLRPEQLQPVRLAGELIRRDLCTPFQMQMLFAGRGRELVLGQYTLLEPLGEGGMGHVYKARHRRLHRVDTLKVIRPERVTSAAALERFLLEARAAVQLNHPNIIGIHDANESNGLHFLAMEYVPGIDLARLVRQVGPLPPGFACHFLRQVALALDHAHRCGIIHRDIKPANMLLNLDLDTVTVLDMGLARL
ncbi:MAG: serine/threonine-protein kinase, partial [Gemmataceae bacterium]